MRLFCAHPNPPPEAWGEGVDDVAGFSNHKALNRLHFFPSNHQWKEFLANAITGSQRRDKPRVAALVGATAVGRPRWPWPWPVA